MEPLNRIQHLLEPGADDPFEALLRNRDWRVIRAIEAFPQFERQILILNQFQGMNCHEISKIVGVPIDAVHFRLYSALAELRKVVETYL